MTQALNTRPTAECHIVELTPGDSKPSAGGRSPSPSAVSCSASTPAQIRDRILSLNQLFISVGLLTSYLVNWALADAELGVLM